MPIPDRRTVSHRSAADPPPASKVGWAYWHGDLIQRRLARLGGDARVPSLIYFVGRQTAISPAL